MITRGGQSRDAGALQRGVEVEQGAEQGAEQGRRARGLVTYI